MLMFALAHVFCSGTTGYRKGFCARRVASLYGYVWLSASGIQLLISPIVSMAEVWIARAIRDFKGDSEPEEASAEEYATGVRDRLVTFEVQAVGLGICFGLWVRVLLLLAPLVVWHQILAFKEIDTYVNLTVGEAVAVRLLVQKHKGFALSRSVGLWTVAIFTVIDLEFEYAPCVLLGMIGVLPILEKIVSLCCYEQICGNRDVIPNSKDGGQQFEISFGHTDVPGEVDFRPETCAVFPRTTPYTNLSLRVADDNCPQ